MAECIVNCLENPDDVDKINWVCVECKTNLKAACEASRKAKAEAAEAKLVEQAANRTGLSDAEIEDRRSMA